MSANKRNYGAFIIGFFAVAVLYISYQVFVISNNVSNIKISDQKVEYVYEKVGDLVNILNTKEDSVNYNPTEKYDFKPVGANELVAEKPADEKEDSAALKEEVSKMRAGDKLKVIRDKLVDIYQQSKTREESLLSLKQSFYETKTMIEGWYNDKKNIKTTAASAKPATSNAGVVDQLKKNLNNFIKVNKVGEDLYSNDKKVLNIDQIPEMLSYAEMLMEAGSLSQVAWILEDIESITKQEAIFTFTSKLEIYQEKNPNPNMEIQRIKELIELIENKE